MIKNFREQLRTQRWDDHRYYHHSRINQSLHFVSAASFLIAYSLLFVNPVAAALVGWLVSMTTRQAGHFFFEPTGYDHVNHATHDHKEEIKVGYNLNRKIVLMTIWALSPLVLYLDPTLFGLFVPWTSPADFMRQVAKVWLAVGIGGLLFRTVLNRTLGCLHHAGHWPAIRVTEVASPAMSVSACRSDRCELIVA